MTPLMIAGIIFLIVLFIWVLAWCGVLGKSLETFTDMGDVFSLDGMDSGSHGVRYANFLPWYKVNDLEFEPEYSE